jgi:hypothetical protein
MRSRSCARMRPDSPPRVSWRAIPSTRPQEETQLKWRKPNTFVASNAQLRILGFNQCCNSRASNDRSRSEGAVNKSWAKQKQKPHSQLNGASESAPPESRSRLLHPAALRAQTCFELGGRGLRSLKRLSAGQKPGILPQWDRRPALPDFSNSAEPVARTLLSAETPAPR